MKFGIQHRNDNKSQYLRWIIHIIEPTNYLPPKISVADEFSVRAVRVRLNHTVSIGCPAMAYPAPLFRWDFINNFIRGRVQQQTIKCKELNVFPLIDYREYFSWTKHHMHWYTNWGATTSLSVIFSEVVRCFTISDLWTELHNFGFSFFDQIDPI